MQIRLALRNGTIVEFKSKYTTVESFSEDLVSIASSNFTNRGDHMNKWGDFIEFENHKHIRYSDIVWFEEVSE